MDEVTQVVQEKKNLYRIVFKYHPSLLVSDEVLVKHRLMKGKQFSEEALKNVVHSITEDTALQQAYHYIDVKMRTKKEVCHYLKSKEHSEDVIASVISRLKDLSLIDDQHYAESFMRTKMREGRWGPKMVTQKLQEKGIAKEIAQASQKEYTNDYYQRNLEHQAEKLMRRYCKSPAKERKNKVYQGLITKGFYSEDIKDYLSHLSFAMEEEEEYMLLCKQGDKLRRKYRKKPFFEQKQLIKGRLYQKGFSFSLIEKYLNEVEENNEFSE